MEHRIASLSDKVNIAEGRGDAALAAQLRKERERYAASLEVMTSQLAEEGLCELVKASIERQEEKFRQKTPRPSR